MGRLNDDDRAAFLASRNQADAARIVGHEGKTFREKTRKRLHVFVSREGQGSWDDRTRAFRLALHEAETSAEESRIARAFAVVNDDGTYAYATPDDVPADVPA